MPTRANTSSPKRDEIVEVASRLFYQQGYGATGIKQIIDEVGIAKGTFYSHYPSKEELGIAWLRARHAQWTGAFENALVSKTGARAKILGAFAFLKAWLDESAFRGCAFLNTMAEVPDASRPMRQEVVRHKTELHERFQDLAIEHLADHGRSKASAREVGTAIYLLFEGSLVESQNFHQTWPVDAAVKVVKNLLSPKNNR